MENRADYNRQLRMITEIQKLIDSTVFQDTLWRYTTAPITNVQRRLGTHFRAYNIEAIRGFVFDNNPITAVVDFLDHIINHFPFQTARECLLEFGRVFKGTALEPILFQIDEGEKPRETGKWYVYFQETDAGLMNEDEGDPGKNDGEGREGIEKSVKEKEQMTSSPHAALVEQSPSCKLHEFLFENDLADIEQSLRRTPLGVKSLSDLDLVMETDLVGGARIDLVPARRLLKAVRELKDKVESRSINETLSRDPALSSIRYAELEDQMPQRTKGTKGEKTLQTLMGKDENNPETVTTDKGGTTPPLTLEFLNQAIQNIHITGDPPQTTIQVKLEEEGVIEEKRNDGQRPVCNVEARKESDSAGKGASRESETGELSVGGAMKSCQKIAANSDFLSMLWPNVNKVREYPGLEDLDDLWDKSITETLETAYTKEVLKLVGDALKKLASGAAKIIEQNKAWKGLFCFDGEEEKERDALIHRLYKGDQDLIDRWHLRVFAYHPTLQEICKEPRYQQIKDKAKVKLSIKQQQVNPFPSNKEVRPVEKLFLCFYDLKQLHVLGEAISLSQLSRIEKAIRQNKNVKALFYPGAQ